MVIRFLLFIVLLSAQTASAQSHQVLFGSTSGGALLDSLTTRYRPNTVLDYGNARDTLYSKVLAKDDDSLRCIYSGHTLYLAPNADPTQYVYLNGSTLGMNAEHGYPQAKGAAEGNARSDMHHLFPARIPVNEARASLPLGDIPDAQTQKWFYKAAVITTIPTVNKDAYSESRATTFEPREASKGDMARAIFYFYTMYKAQADFADPNFFELQRPTLCQWNNQDPVDAAEMIKTWRIAPYQENKPNPFIIDCTMAYRVYCPNNLPTCLLSADDKTVPRLPIKVAPQPFQGSTQLNVDIPFSGDLVCIIRSIDGRELQRIIQENVPIGRFVQPITLDTPAKTMVFLEIHLRSKNGAVLSNVVPLLQILD